MSLNVGKLRAGMKLFEDGHWESLQLGGVSEGDVFASRGPGQVPCRALTSSSPTTGMLSASVLLSRLWETNNSRQG